MEKGGKGEKNPGDFPLVFLSYSSSCFQKKHLSQNMCSLTTVFTHFQVLLCWVQAREYWRLKKKKVVKSSPVQLYLAFWYSSVIYLLIGTSKSSLIVATFCTNFIVAFSKQKIGYVYSILPETRSLNWYFKWCLGLVPFFPKYLYISEIIVLEMQLLV